MVLYGLMTHPGCYGVVLVDPRHVDERSEVERIKGLIGFNPKP